MTPEDRFTYTKATIKKVRSLAKENYDFLAIPVILIGLLLISFEDEVLQAIGGGVLLTSITWPLLSPSISNRTSNEVEK